MNACSRTASAWRLDLLIIILLAPLPTLAARFAGGTGDPNDPYQIATAAQLTSIGADPTLLNKHYVLLNDIDLDPNLPGNRVFNQAVIGRVGERLGEFKGRFSGAGHIIRNLVIVSESEYPVGLFSDVGRGAEVEQLGIENARISGVDAVGTLAGENGGRIIACYATGIVKCLPRPRDSTDKTVPEADEGYDQMMRQLRKIYGDRYMKQLFDPNDRVEIPVRAGGLVAYNGRRIESCYAQVAVEGAAEDPNAIDAGALAGANSGSIFASYSAGRVATGSGGLVGNNTYTATGPTPLKGYVSLSFWDAQASGCATSAAGTSRTTAQMRDPQSFRGWDYQGHWTIDDGADYPRLRWEKRAAAPMPAFGAYADGTGKLGDPFVIRKAEELAMIGRFRTTWDSHFVLANDVDMSAIDPNDLLCIGTLYLPFTGTFDGRGRTIHNFTFRPKDEGRAGLFGLVGHRRLDQLPRVGLIENVKVQHGSVTGSTRVGLLVAENWGTIRACHVHGSVTGTRSYAGGLVGFSAGRIDTCTSSGMVQGSDDVGGLVGSSFGKNDAIENCSSSCTVVGRKPVGGLTGYAGGSVRNSYASGSVRGDSDVGGLIGNATARVWACYATGDVTGDEDVGGLAGESLVSTVACYASGTVHGGTGVGGLVGHNSGGIVACYSTGKVTGDKAFGGLIGSQRFMRIGDWRVGADRLCFWDRQT
ncbi:MAG: GLUG motif-containing protein, partial [Planctomycetota bacterium]